MNRTLAGCRTAHAGTNRHERDFIVTMAISSDAARSAAANDNRPFRPNRVVLNSADKAGIFLFWMLAWTVSGLLLALMMRYS